MEGNGDSPSQPQSRFSGLRRLLRRGETGRPTPEAGDAACCNGCTAGCAADLNWVPALICSCKVIALTAG